MTEVLTRHMDRKNLYAFLFISFVLTWLIIIPFDFFILRYGADKYVDTLFLISHSLGMLAPGAACIYVKKYIKKESLPKLNFNYKHIWIYIVITLSYAIIWLSPLVVGYFYGEVNIKTLNLDSMIFIAALLFLGSLGAYGEELGWRGFLLPELRCIGIKKATILHGFIWGLWHLALPISVILYAINNINSQGKPLNDPIIQSSVMSMFLIPIGCVLTSIIPAFLQLRYSSLFMVSLWHASHNYFRDVNSLFFEIKTVGIDAAGNSPALSVVDSMGILISVISVVIVPIAIFLFCKEFKRVSLKIE